ncbi:MAG: DNA starvation/stationary phase protection protein [Alphaproteobacteria bacterium]|nr:MAG: DNA starvation/stationary phase protection protein [Alphaproteobacteria bacterium]
MSHPHHNARSEVATKLGGVLASTYTLYLKTQNCHWNVRGPRFYFLHEMFGAQYQELQAAIDEIAERMRALGQLAPGSFAEFTKLSTIEDAPTTALDESGMIALLAKGHRAMAALASELRVLADEHGDTATGDLMNGRIHAHDKAAWMLESHEK